MARPFLLVSILINEDFPTFERPINANSGNLNWGHELMFGELEMNSAVVITILYSAECGLLVVTDSY